MPTCGYQTVAWDADNHPFGVTVPCGQPATHRIDLAVAGASPVTSGAELGYRAVYCCGHRRDALAEIDGYAAITVRNDVVLDAAVRTEIADRNGWQMRIHVKHHGVPGEVATPWMRLAATSEHGATLEAAARSAVIQSNVMGDHR